jgi:molybdopterin molybdotransferase
MLTLSEAQAALTRAVVAATRTETVPLAQAGGRYLAQAVTARVDNPAFDNSAMDGYAFALADLVAQDFVLPLRGEASCGDAPATLAPGSTMRIFTGAPLPAGANTIEMQENVRVEAGRVHFPRSVCPGAHRRKRGEDFRAGATLYSAGQRLRTVDLALLAAAGVPEVSAFACPRVLVVATGNELVAPGTPLAPGQIYESNRLVTLVQLAALGAEAIDGGTVRDDPAALRALLQRAGEFDFVITSGGASVGDHDLVKPVFAEIGHIEFWKVRIKPGKPVAFGRVGSRTHFFALPGNPVSSLVTFKLFVEPALAAWHHAAHTVLECPALAANDFKRRPDRLEFLRARLYNDQGRLYAEALPGQGSHQLAPLAHTNGFIKLAEDSSGFKTGDSVTVIPLLAP